MSLPLPIKDGTQEAENSFLRPSLFGEGLINFAL